jgi:hypothetical protein
MQKTTWNTVKSAIIGVICGLLGAWAGAEGTNKLWRRFIIPFTLTGLAWGYLHNWWVLTMMSMFFALSAGYGIPSPTDKGSLIGRFWYKIWKGNTTLANIYTRGTIGFLVNLSFISIPIIKGNWITYTISSISILLAYTIFSWRDLGGFYYKGKRLLWVDVITYGTIGLMICISIFF